MFTEIIALIKIGRKNVYVRPGRELSFRHGSSGPYVCAGALIASLAKGDARRLRKAARAAGMGVLAHAERQMLLGVPCPCPVRPIHSCI